MTAAERIATLDKARELTRRARVNYEKWARGMGAGAREALDRADRQQEEADRLFDALRADLAV
jgi:hypothetical protein